MSANDCACGTPTHQLGCLQCGAAVCPRCALPMESPTYCRSCATTLLDVPDVQSVEPFDVN